MLRLWLFFSLILLMSCTSVALPCDLPCRLGVEQDEPITVDRFIDLLAENGWIHDDPDRTFYAEYASDAFSNVLETTVLIELDGYPPEAYGSTSTLYIGHVGSVQLDQNAVPDQMIEKIQVDTNVTLLESWLLYGIPQGGEVFPFYLKGDLDETNPCPDRSHYIAYYEGGRTIIRSVVKRPIWLNMWTSPVEIVYPFGEELDFAAEVWIGRYHRMDHIPCMP